MLPPLALYVHLPWCVRKCPYCDFNSHRGGERSQRMRYVSALTSDLHAEALRAGARSVQSIFLGGGTPSLFTPDEISTTLDVCREAFQLSADCEITMEANPGTVERGSLSHYQQAGVTRLSLGAQSFSQEMLTALGRIHSPDDIMNACDEARVAGFDSINIDLMFALPGQDVAAAVSDVEALLSLQPAHVSYYQLTLEPNTVFYASPPANMPDDELSWQIQEQGQQRLEQAGLTQYEISAYAKPGHRSRHNLNYWTFGDYLAAGAGAHGKLSSVDGAIHRYNKPANPLVYMEWAEGAKPDCTMTPVASRDKGFEFMLNALRLTEGFSAVEFEASTGESVALVTELLQRAQADGLMERDAAERWKTTALGQRFLNDLQARFLA